VENSSLQTLSPRRYLRAISVNEVRSVNNGAVKVSEAGSTEATELTEKVQTFINSLLGARGITPNAVQEQMLTSHVRAMAHRSLTGEPLPEVEESLFEEISPDSLAMAKEVVDQFGNLPIEEAWLLSVHFEVAKDNL
jgi:PRD domain protein (TIGR03582 family)